MAEYLSQEEMFGASNPFGVFGIIRVMMSLKNLLTFQFHTLFRFRNYARV